MKGDFEAKSAEIERKFSAVAVEKSTLEREYGERLQLLDADIAAEEADLRLEADFS